MRSGKDLSDDPAPSLATATEPGEVLSRKTHRGAIRLADPGNLWQVDTGGVDVFFVHVKDGAVHAPYKHALRAEAGQLVFGVEPFDLGDDGSLELWAKGLPGFRLRCSAVDDFVRQDDRSAVAEGVDDWISAITDAVTEDIQPVPRVDTFISQHDPSAVAAGDVVSARGGVAWLPVDETVTFYGPVDATEPTPADDTAWLPVTLRSWLTYSAPVERIVARTTLHMLETGRLQEALGGFHRRLLDAERVNRVLAAVDDANLQMDRATTRRRDEERARVELDHLIREQTGEAPDSTLARAMNAVADYEGIELKPAEPDAEAGVDPVIATAYASRVRLRHVRLGSHRRWWFGDNGALLGFRKEDGSPVALLPGKLGRYRLVDPDDDTSTRVGAATAARLHDRAWMFIRPFPERSVGVRDNLRLLAKHIGLDSFRFALAGLAFGLISFVPAAVVAVMADWLLPLKSQEFLWLAVATLLLLATVGLFVQVYQNATLLKVEGRVATRMTAALWDRLLRLRREHIRAFKSGDLSQRAFVFHHLREQLSGIVDNTVAAMLFLLPTLMLLFLYDAVLATASILLGVVALVAFASFGLVQRRWQHRRHAARQALSGHMFQFVNGMAKLRATGAESSVFAFWARSYRDKKRAEIKIDRINALVSAMSSSLPAFAAALLFAVALNRPGPIEVGDFLAVYAASMLFFAAMARLGGSIGVVASVVPAYRHARPLLEPPLKDDPRQGGALAIGEVKGDIRLDHVSFKYGDDGELVLDDVSMTVRAGEFVAIVGESGSGKSTILRLILGLDRPSAGAVYVDERNLLYLDDDALRRHFGVVAQNGSLQPGTLLQNIIGLNTNATMDDAWDAARKACVADDIRAMEMHMYTPVSEDAGQFSGGQAQRILLAAALVRRPGVIILDEATNWLDNRSQAEVMRSITEIAATRVVVAHRLSTIRSADRIYVMSNGKVVQSGTYEDLAGAPGLFRKLATRQIA